MKKLLSIILTVCMLFSLVIVPVTVNAEEVTYEETTLGGYYKFTFGEDEMYNYAFGEPVTYKGDTFYPLSAAGSTGSSVGYKAVTDVDTKDVYDTLEVKTGSANIVFTPVTKDGQPFEMTPGVEYTVKVNMFNPASHCWAQSYITLGKNKVLFGTSAAYGGTNLLEYKNGTFVNSQTPFASSKSLAVQGGQGFAFSFPEGTYGKSTILGDCVHPALEKEHGSTCGSYNGYKPSKVFRELNINYTVDTEHFEYNAETNSYSADMKAYDFIKLNTQPDDWAENYASYYVFESWKFQPNKSETFTAGSVFRKAYRQDVAVNNYLSLCFAGGNAHGNVDGYPLFGTATKADVYTEDGKVIPSYDCYQIESIEVFETGKGFANIHLGDTVTQVKGNAGDAISLGIPAAPEGKYFVAWYTDAEFTTPVTKDQTIVEGACVDYYARFAEYGSYVKNDYTSNKYPVTAIQMTSAGYYYATKGYSFKGNTYKYGTTDSVLKTTDNIIRELEAKGYATTPESGTLVFFSDRTWGMPGGITALNDDGTLFMPEAGAKYKVTYRYRSLLNNGSDMSINITYGISNTFANKDTTGDKTAHKATLKTNTLADVVPEWTVKSEIVNIPATGADHVPAIGLLITGVGKKKVFADDGETVIDYTHTVVELDYLEVEKLKDVTFTAADDSTTVGSYAKGDAITYPELTDGDWYEAKWSLSKDEYIAVPETMGDEEFTVYEYRQKTKNIVTYVNGSKTSYKYYANGEKIDYTKAANAVLGVDYAWSASATEYVKPDQTASGDITVYWIRLDKISFENQYYATYGSHAWLNAAMISEDYALTGTKSLKIENYNMNLRPSRYVAGSAAADQYIGSPKDEWGTEETKLWNNWYTYDAATDTFNKINSETDPGWEANKYYAFRAGNAVEAGLFYGKELGPNKDSSGNVIAYTYSYKVSFKYYAPKANADGFKVSAYHFNPANIWWGSAVVGQGENISAEATDGWQTYEFLVSAENMTKGATSGGTIQCFALSVQPIKYNVVNARDSVIYIDDVVIEEYVNTPTVIFHDGENVTEVTEGVVAGADYTPSLVGTNAPEGLGFKGWSTTADGLNIVSTVKMPAADRLCKVHLYAVYGATPKVIYHDNGAEIEVTEGLVGGSDYVIDRVGAGAEGKYFAGWATTENGTSYVTKINITEAGDAKNHLYAVYIAYPDEVTYDVSGNPQPTLQGYPTLTDGAITDVKLNESGWAQKIYTENGVHFEKSLGGASKWNPALVGTSGSHAQTGSRNDIVAHTADNPVGTQIQGGWSADSNYVLRDKNGNAVIAKPNTKYAVIVTYEKTGNGNQKLSVGMGRKVEYINKGADSYGPTYSRFYSSTIYNFANEPKNFENTHIFTVTTKNFTEGDVPVISLHYSGDNVIIERIAADANGVESYTMENGTTYYPYKIIEAPSILIKNVKIIEIDADKVGVTFGRYNAENGSYDYEFKEGVPGTPLDADTHNYDSKWYKKVTTDAPHAYNISSGYVVTTYPTSNATYYNATYGQLNPLSGTFVTGDGKKNGGAEKEWAFENALYDGKYALHIGGAKVAIGAGDVETYMTGVNVEQGHTYKVSFKYKATAAHGKFGFNFRICQGENFWSNSNGDKASMSVAAGEATENWVQKDAYFTVDLTGTNMDESETGIDYNVARDYRKTLQMVFIQDAFEAGNDLYFADIEIVDLGEVVTTGGASVLTSAAADAAGMQAMRYYFNYKTVDGSQIIIGNETLKVVERGFLYRNGAVASGAAVASLYTAPVKQTKDSNFNQCWKYDEETQMMKFSTYVTGFKKENDTRKLEVNAYIIVELEDGSRYTIYSGSINRSVAGVQGLGAATDSDVTIGQ